MMATDNYEREECHPSDVCHSYLIIIFENQKNPPVSSAFLTGLPMVTLVYGCLWNWGGRMYFMSINPKFMFRVFKGYK